MGDVITYPNHHDCDEPQAYKDARKALRIRAEVLRRRAVVKSRFRKNPIKYLRFHFIIFLKFVIRRAEQLIKNLEGGTIE